MQTEGMLNNINGSMIDAVRIGIASPEQILEWSGGEVTKAETINYRTYKPERGGLFCEKIFGPTKDYTCTCGKFKGIKYKGYECDRCGVKLEKSDVRRERMGHIELVTPVCHIWHTKGIPSNIGAVLGISQRQLERVVYFNAFIVTDKGDTGLSNCQILTWAEYNEAVKRYGNRFRAGMGAAAIKELLSSVDVDAERNRLHKRIKEAGPNEQARLAKRLKVLDSFYQSGLKPEWMVLDVIPVMPPELRPMIQLQGGRWATSDINELYRRVINRNNRLRQLMAFNSPDLMLNNERRMLQEAVDSLFENGRRGRAVTGAGNRALKSLSDYLKGKQGRFRQNLLGKRVDYSGRSVIVVGPELKIYQCGLPKEMAAELFKPFMMKELVKRELASNVKAAKKMVETLHVDIWDVLEDVIREHPVMLNRAPTLHRLGIQAFEPVLVEGKAIRLHPLVCTAFNADFDGDQMAVHVPLSVEAQAEARFLMLSPNNLLKPSDGGPVAVPSQDMVLGIYYLTQERPDDKGEGKCFASVNEAMLACENNVISLHAKIKVRRTVNTADGRNVSGIIETTLGRCIFNEIVPQDLGFVVRTEDADYLLHEIEFLVGKKQLKKILEKCISVHGSIKTAEFLDAVKAMGYKYSTKAAMTVSISDMTVPERKQEILETAEQTVGQITRNFRRGLTTEEERYKAVIETWRKADDEITAELLSGLDKYNNIYMMADSGARGSDKQIKQLAGMRGLMADTSGRTIELPIKSNFREGLDVLEYFISAHGARKGLSDTALRTADSGYLTRRLVDVSHELVVRKEDCAENSREIPSVMVRAFRNGNEVVESLEERITGRVSGDTIYDSNGEVIVYANQMITSKRASRIWNKIVADVEQEVSAYRTKDKREKERQRLLAEAGVLVRTVLSCNSRYGICSKCYGSNMATGELVHVGEAVGVIAAQSIGEPGTQLTMRTFHTGGVAGDDITQGLPRVEELFEARKPKGVAIISEIGGKVTIKQTAKKREVIVTNKKTAEEKNYLIPYGNRVKVKEGQLIDAGDELTEGSVNPQDLLKVKGVQAVQDYILREVQRVYRLQGVEINDKHVEIIVRQMMKNMRVQEVGDSKFLPGSVVHILDFEEENKRLIEEGLEPAAGRRLLLGITKAALTTESFLSEASFQETVRVLTEASVRGREDRLTGMKENVIIGKLIPAGTGHRKYSDVRLATDNTDYSDNDSEWEEFYPAEEFLE